MPVLTFAPLRRARAVLAISLAAMAFAAPAAAQEESAPQATEIPKGAVGGMGDVNLFPKRVVIDSTRAVTTVGMYNKTVDDGEYEIKLVDMAMTPDGRLVTFENLGDEALKARVKSASSFLRYSPRRVALAGSEAQTVRIMARAQADLPPGEYRTHFLAVSVPKAREGFSIEDAVGNTAPDSIGVTIRPRFGISIPVIVRVGATTLDVGMENLQLFNLPDGSPALGVTLTRSGTRSAFGDLTITAPGSDIPVAVSRGIGVYPEIDARKVVVPINPELEARFRQSGTRWTVTFTDDDYEPGAKLAEQAFLVP